MQNWPWAYKFEQTFGFFTPPPPTHLTCPFPATNRPMKLFLAGNTHEHNIVQRFLWNQGYGPFYKRLVSFAYIPDCEIMFNQKRNNPYDGTNKE
jgi:hypothetical protein